MIQIPNHLFLYTSWIYHTNRKTIFNLQYFCSNDNFTLMTFSTTFVGAIKKLQKKKKHEHIFPKFWALFWCLEFIWGALFYFIFQNSPFSNFSFICALFEPDLSQSLQTVKASAEFLALTLTCSAPCFTRPPTTWPVRKSSNARHRRFIRRFQTALTSFLMKCSPCFLFLFSPSRRSTSSSSSSRLASPASPPLPPPPPQGTEGAPEAQEARPQRGRSPWRRGGPGAQPQPRPLLNANNENRPASLWPPWPFRLCSAATCRLPDSTFLLPSLQTHHTLKTPWWPECPRSSPSLPHPQLCTASPSHFLFAPPPWFVESTCTIVDSKAGRVCQASPGH